MGAFFFSKFKGGVYMLTEVYYEHYRENCKGAYWEEPISIPYGVYDRDRKARNSFYGYLTTKGFKCVTWNNDYPLILVNTELKRFGLIYRACAHKCVDSRNYTIQEFKDEVLNIK